MSSIPIAVGFSVNGEINFSYDATSAEGKIPLQDSQATLGGSSFNTAMALHQLGIKDVSLTGLIGKEFSPFKCMVEGLLQEVPFPSQMIEALDVTSLAFLPLSTVPDKNGKKLSKVIGKRGSICPEHLDETKNKIEAMKKSLQPKLCLALGVQKDEIVLAEKLFSREHHKHLNVLVLSAGAFQPESRLEHVLCLTDFIFMSDYEYAKLLKKDSAFNFSGLHQLGISLIVVTENCHGGQVSFCKNGNTSQIHYDSLKSSSFVSEVGAGDWFLGGFIAKMVHDKVIDIDAVTLDDVERWIKFASLVAGIKVGYVGASNGPTLAELKPYDF